MLLLKSAFVSAKFNARCKDRVWCKSWLLLTEVQLDLVFQDSVYYWMYPFRTNDSWMSLGATRVIKSCFLQCDIFRFPSWIDIQLKKHRASSENIHLGLWRSWCWIQKGLAHSQPVANRNHTSDLSKVLHASLNGTIVGVLLSFLSSRTQYKAPRSDLIQKSNGPR